MYSKNSRKKLAPILYLIVAVAVEWLRTHCVFAEKWFNAQQAWRKI